MDVGLRERKKRETRIALSWAAVRLSVERGVENVRIEDIAAEANVSVRTFRNYFANKAEAIAARQLDRVLHIADELRARPADEPLWPAITNAVLTQFALGEDNGTQTTPDLRWIEGVRLMMTEPTLQGEVCKANAAAQTELARAIAERTGTDADRDLYPALVAAVVGSASAAVTSHWLTADPPVPAADLLREAFGQIAAGLPTP
jgi:AcrR family transcriptional regulator